MKENFDLIMRFVLAAEGLLANDPADPGGMTYRGISRRFWPKWEGWECIDRQDFSAADEHVLSFYRENFWDKVKGDNIPWPLDLFVMDAAVNMGVGTALKMSTEPDFIHARLRRYLTITKKNPALKKFLWTWINRTLECEEEAKRG